MSAVTNTKISDWVAIANHLCRNAPQSTLCPDCQTASLKVRDIEYGPAGRRGKERYIACTHCGAFQVINVRRAGQPPRD
jgi:hypothetical protein